MELKSQSDSLSFWVAKAEAALKELSILSQEISARKERLSAELAALEAK